MIEISTIHDIRNIESRLIGGFTGRQLIAIIIAIIIDVFLFIMMHSMFLIMIASLIILGIGFIKKNNMTAIQYAKYFWNKKQQPKVRTYKNKNIMSEIEKQCKLYKTKKRRS